MGQILNTIVGNWGEEKSYADLLNVSNAFFSDIEEGTSGTGNFSADPLFLSPESDDFHLRSGSPCINTGVKDGVMRHMGHVPEYDFDGNLRLAPDVGADEFDGLD